MNRAGLQVDVESSTHGLRPEQAAAQTLIADSVPLRSGSQDTRGTGIARAIATTHTLHSADQNGPYPLAIPAARLVELDDISIGSGAVCWMAGPRYVESITQLREVAQAARSCGLRFLRARAWWPWAKEEDFDRHFLSGLTVLRDVAREFGLYVVSEIVHIRHLEAMQKLCDVIEVGGPVLSHKLLLSELGGTGKTILMNRAPDMNVADFLSAVNIVARRARPKILLLESGSRSFDSSGDTVLDLSAIVALRQETSHPVFVDPTAVCRNSSHVRNIAVAAIAAGADGIVVELRPDSAAGAASGVISTPGLTGSSLAEMIRHACAFKHTLNALTMSCAAPTCAFERMHGERVNGEGSNGADNGSAANGGGRRPLAAGSASHGSQPNGGVSAEAASGNRGTQHQSSQSTGSKNIAKLGPMRRSPAAA